MSWALWLVISAATHAAWNALLKREADPRASAVPIVAGAALLSLGCGLALDGQRLPASSWLWASVAGLVEGVYFVSLGAALARLPLPIAYGLSRGGGMLMLWPLSLLLLGEQASPVTLFGAALLTTGLFLQVGLAPRGEGSSRRGLVWAWVCAVSIASYPLAYKRALGPDASPFFVFAFTLGVSLPIQIAALGRQWRARIGAALGAGRGRLSLAAALCAFSFLVFVHALRENGPAYSTALRNTSVLFAAVWGAMSGERMGRLGWAAAAAVGVGAALVSV